MTTTTKSSPGAPTGAPPPRLTAREVARFTVAVALLAIFSDAALGHGLAWENDPYWTYWVTKTFLIATVFGLGTAWLGLGPGRGAVITAVHTLVLTVYYWSLSPIGLPSSPEWLDLEHTWLSGLPIHFGVIYLGYLTALWLWRRREAAASEAAGAGRQALVALAAGVAIVVLAGGAASLAVGDFPGFTWFLVRLLITVPIIMVWWSAAGRGWAGALSGAVVLALAWATYGEFLGPGGLPDTPLRLFTEAPPSATVSWMDYRDLWLISLPIYVLAMSLVLLAAARLLRTEPGRPRSFRRPAAAPLLAGLALILVVVAPTAIAIPAAEKGGSAAAIDASGPAQVEVGPFYEGSLVASQATLSLRAEDVVRRVTPLPPHDELSVEASVAHPNGRVYDVLAREPMVSDPLGRHTTWWGVGFEVWHHGRTGIGSNRLPEIHSDLAAFGVGEVRSGGRLLATGVPVHVMSADEGLPGTLELDVGDHATPVVGLPDGHLRVIWPAFSGGVESGADRLRYTVGSIVLAGLLVLALLVNAAPGRARLRP